HREKAAGRNFRKGLTGTGDVCHNNQYRFYVTNYAASAAKNEEREVHLEKRKHSVYGELKLYRSRLKEGLSEKLKEAVSAVVPVLVIVLILSFTIAPLPVSVLMEF